MCVCVCLCVVGNLSIYTPYSCTSSEHSRIVSDHDQKKVAELEADQLELMTELDDMSKASFDDLTNLSDGIKQASLQVHQKKCRH